MLVGLHRLHAMTTNDIVEKSNDIAHDEDVEKVSSDVAVEYVVDATAERRYVFSTLKCISID